MRPRVHVICDVVRVFGTHSMSSHPCAVCGDRTAVKAFARLARWWDYCLCKSCGHIWAVKRAIQRSSINSRQSLSFHPSSVEMDVREPSLASFF